MSLASRQRQSFRIYPVLDRLEERVVLATVSFEAPSTVAAGERFDVDVVLDTEGEVVTAPFLLTITLDVLFENDHLNFVDVEQGPFPSGFGPLLGAPFFNYPVFGVNTPPENTVAMIAGNVGEAPPSMEGRGVFATITLQARTGMPDGTVTNLDIGRNVVADMVDFFTVIPATLTISGQSDPVSQDPQGNLIVLGTDEDDTILFSAETRSAVTLDYNDELFGPFDLRDRTIEVQAGAGDDVIQANNIGLIDVIVFGGEGNDSIDGSRGADRFVGGIGDDVLNGRGGTDLLEGGTGRDTIRGGNAIDTLLGGEGNDDLDGNVNNDLIEGGFGDDTLSGNRGDDILIGGAGADLFFGRGGSDLIDGGQGNDTAFGGGGQDTIDGGIGNDVLDGQSADDEILGNQGDDQLEGGNNGDTIRGGEGNDTISGGRGTDILFGDNGLDVFRVGAAVGSEPFGDLHNLRFVNGFLQHRTFRGGDAIENLIEQDRILGFSVDDADQILIATLGGNDTITIDDGVELGGSVDGGDGIDTALIDAAIRASWILVNIEQEGDD